LANGPHFIDLFLACLRCGVIFVPANVMYREREMAHIVADAEPALIVTAEPELFADDARVVTIAAFSTTHTEHTETAETADRASARADDDAAVIIYTSGTTGRAKGAVLSHGNLAANAAHLVEAWRITARDRYLAVLPLFHVHGLGNGICSWLWSGCLMRLQDKFDQARALGWFSEFRPTLFFGVPTIYLRMLEWPATAAPTVATDARLFVSGSAPLPAHVLEAFRARYGHTILERYGMSETLMNLGNPCDGERRAGSVGLPFHGVSARIVDDSGAPVVDGNVGQLEVRGPNVFREYWRNPDATANAFRDGWFRTGDLAERAPDGYFTLRGRAGDLIISGGFNIYPREVEEVLLEVADVREAVVVGVPDARRGEVPVAYIVAEDGAVGDDALRAACARSLASFKVPRAFVRMGALPRTALGKVQKHLLPPWSAS
ncbi:MAG: AMP-binding protein, partial [Gemmatimonadota bacterium]|nr:AMP-binding protein [Gemmatimonadota bacterium]